MRVWAVSLLSHQLSPARLTAHQIDTVFGVWLNMRRCRPKPIQCSTPVPILMNAIPLYISGRTSYLRVRLAYYP